MASLGFQWSCATQPQRSPQGQKQDQLQSSKSTGYPSQQIDKPGTKIKNAPTSVAGSTLQIRYLHLLDQRKPLTEADRQAVRTLDAQANPLEEAIMLLTALRHLAAEPSGDQEQGFVSRDISAGTPDQDETVAQADTQAEEANAQTATLLVTAIQELEINLQPWQALDRNPFLQLPRVYQFASQAIANLGDPPRDRQNLRELLQQRANTWANLTRSMPGAQAETDTQPAGSQMESKSIDLKRYSLADLNRGDSLLRQAQKFAERQEYKRAIKFAGRISNQDPMFPTAKEKIKEFSNRAVQDLRQKAAQAFQSALPVNDRNTKAAYLEQAKQYLVKALEEFPEADQLGTVKENLAVISKDLESLQR
jgi:hypothetical protein